MLQVHIEGPLLSVAHLALRCAGKCLFRALSLIILLSNLEIIGYLTEKIIYCCKWLNLFD
jgi:hypothetical protein